MLRRSDDLTRPAVAERGVQVRDRAGTVRAVGITLHASGIGDMTNVEREADMGISYDLFREFDQLAQQLLSGGRSPRSFPMDAYKRGDDFFVHLDLPGVDPGSIDITVEGPDVTISAERRFDSRRTTRLRERAPTGAVQPRPARRQASRLGSDRGQL